MIGIQILSFKALSSLTDVIVGSLGSPSIMSAQQIWLMFCGTFIFIDIFMKFCVAGSNSVKCMGSV